MEYIYIIVLGVFFILISVVFFILYRRYDILKEENYRLEELLIRKKSIIYNYEHSRVVVKKVIKNIPNLDEIKNEIKAGESKESIAKKFNIPISKIEFILKIEALKNDT